MAEQSEAYKFVNEVNRLADQVGADQARDVLRVFMAGQGEGASLDVTAEDVPTEPNTRDAAGGKTRIDADESHSETLDALGAKRLVGRVNRPGQYKVVVRWQAEDGTTLFTETPINGAENTKDYDLKAIAPRAEVTVEDQSSSSRKATYSHYMR